MRIIKKHWLRQFIINRLPRSVILKIKIYLFGESPLLIFGGHGGTLFDDNARALAQYSRTKYPNTAFVILKKRHAPEVLQDNIIPLKMGSWKTRVALKAADAIFFTHSLKDLTQDIRDLPEECPRVYLGHGIWAFKRVERNGLNSANRSFTHTIAASQPEVTLKCTTLSIKKQQVLASGLPKHQRLSALAQDTFGDGISFNVLYAPTWRDWLSGKEIDADELDNFCKNVEALFKSAPTHTPDGRKLIIKFLNHRNARRLSDRLRALCEKHGVIFLIPGGRVTNVLAEMDGVITDYSSIFWDFLVTNRPISRYTFDDDMYQTRIGTYKIEDVDKYSPGNILPERVWETLFDHNTIENLLHLKRTRLEFCPNNTCEFILKELGFNG